MLRGEGREIDTEFGQHDLCRPHTDAVEAGEVDAGEFIKLLAHRLIATPAYGFLFAGARMTGRGLVLALPGCQRGELFLKLHVIGIDHRLELIVMAKCHGEIKQVLFAPRTR